LLQCVCVCVRAHTHTHTHTHAHAHTHTHTSERLRETCLQVFFIGVLTTDCYSLCFTTHYMTHSTRCILTRYDGTSVVTYRYLSLLVVTCCYLSHSFYALHSHSVRRHDSLIRVARCSLLLTTYHPSPLRTHCSLLLTTYHPLLLTTHYSRSTYDSW